MQSKSPTRLLQQATGLCKAPGPLHPMLPPWPLFHKHPPQHHFQGRRWLLGQCGTAWEPSSHLRQAVPVHLSQRKGYTLAQPTGAYKPAWWPHVADRKYLSLGSPPRSHCPTPAVGVRLLTLEHQLSFQQTCGTPLQVVLTLPGHQPAQDPSQGLSPSPSHS